MPKKTDANNGVKSKKLIKLSKNIWELGKGWVYTTQLSAKSAEQEFKKKNGVRTLMVKLSSAKS